ncbi:SGNH/GDSL hydrolase family protein [Massilia sp. ST3]|uniref:SGNH/GDSL hydrolase family protein n=1 Tax=Massilia sp. ST3 TaxID=2824903 RepID=UPI001B8144EA|nr:SGNH/GDSL hydrolase family protein [Massilia sp. ST3]MBQ5949089.1 SGNH/GDSL hydrolase family protein [Massilia sp. ST3]
MTTHLAATAFLGLALAFGGDALADAEAPGKEQWITSWYAAPQPGWDGSFVLPMNVPAYLDKQTVRDTIRLSTGGRRIRLVFSNRYGSAPLKLGEVRVHGEAGQPQPLRFGGKTDAVIPPGAALTSDALAFPVSPLARLSVSSYLPERTAVSTFHWGGQQSFRLLPGNVAGSASSQAGVRVEGRLFLNAVLVEAAPGSRTMVTLGDSITDGNGSTPDADRRWPDFLAQRLAPHGVAVANAGISGARLLRDGMGRSALARFEQDVLSQPGISDLIVLLGINDIGWPGSPFAPQERAVTLDELSAGYRQLAAAAHARGVRVTAGTLPPFEGALEGTPFAGHYSPAKESMRQQLNAWIRTAGVFDAVVDFDAVLRDPGNPRRMRAAFDSGDHLHPGDAGYRAMAAAVDIAPMLRRAHAATGKEGTP